MQLILELMHGTGYHTLFVKAWKGVKFQGLVSGIHRTLKNEKVDRIKSFTVYGTAPKINHLSCSQHLLLASRVGQVT